MICFCPQNILYLHQKSFILYHVVCDYLLKEKVTQHSSHNLKSMHQVQWLDYFLSSMTVYGGNDKKTLALPEQLMCYKNNWLSFPRKNISVSFASHIFPFCSQVFSPTDLGDSLYERIWERFSYIAGTTGREGEKKSLC